MPFVKFVVGVVYLTYLGWALYLSIKIAEHVNAWPF